MIRLLDNDAIGGAEVNMQSPKITVLIFGFCITNFIICRKNCYIGQQFAVRYLYLLTI